MKKDGMFFWLKTLNGNLHHHADGIPKRIGKLEASTWYVVDAVLHIDRGSYDLRVVNAKSREVLALLKDQPNATHSAGSKISKLSFTGDLEDRSTVNYYVDDVELKLLSSPFDLDTPSNQTSKPRFREATSATTDSNSDYVLQASPSSPKKGYLDEFKELRQLLLERPVCLPATALADFGITQKELRDLENANEIKRVISAPEDSIPTPQSLTDNSAKTIAEWRLGCIALAAGDFRSARVLQ